MVYERLNCLERSVQVDRTVYLLYCIWWTKDGAEWRCCTCLVHQDRGMRISVDCTPACMVYSELRSVEKWRLCTCLYGLPRTELTVWRRVDCIPVLMVYQELSYVVKEPVCIVCQEPNCVESIGCAVCAPVLPRTPVCGDWGSVDCMCTEVPVCMVGRGLSYEIIPFFCLSRNRYRLCRCLLLRTELRGER